MTTYHSFLSASCPTTHLVVQKNHESTKPESHPTAFFFFPSSKGLVQNCMTFMMVFVQNSSIYTEQCISPSIFHNFEVSQGSSNHSLNSHGFISDANFKTCMHAHKSHRAFELQ